MGSCGCGTGGSGSTRKTAMQDDMNFRWTGGSLSAGATLRLLNADDKKITPSKLIAPNILEFSFDPCLRAGSTMIMSGAVDCVSGFNECVTVTATPVVVAGKYQVSTNAAFTIGNGLPFLDLAGTTKFNIGCEPTTDTATQGISFNVCKANTPAFAYSGKVFNRPSNTAPKLIKAYGINGSTRLKVKERVLPSPGDSFDIIDTATSGVNKATVISVTRSGSDDPWVIKLDRPLIGATGATQSDGTICLTAESQPQVIATMGFSNTCSCSVLATIDQNITSQPTFPSGLFVEDENGCMLQEYCFEITASSGAGSKVIVRGKIEL